MSVCLSVCRLLFHTCILSSSSYCSSLSFPPAGWLASYLPRPSSSYFQHWLLLLLLLLALTHLSVESAKHTHERADREADRPTDRPTDGQGASSRRQRRRRKTDRRTNGGMDEQRRRRRRQRSFVRSFARPCVRSFVRSFFLRSFELTAVATYWKRGKEEKKEAAEGDTKAAWTNGRKGLARHLSWARLGTRMYVGTDKWMAHAASMHAMGREKGQLQSGPKRGNRNSACSSGTDSSPPSKSPPRR